MDRTSIRWGNRSPAILACMDPLVPLWLKLAYTVMVVVVIVVYALRYPLSNFLWFSDIALIVLVPALWFESSILASMMALAVLVPECFWTLSFLCQWLTGRRISGLTDYMFDATRPRNLRALSLFHLVLPPLLIWLVATLGYDPLALPAMIVLAGVVLLASYLLSTPAQNVNWVYGPGDRTDHGLPQGIYLVMLMAAFIVFVYLPTHFALVFAMS